MIDTFGQWDEDALRRSLEGDMKNSRLIHSISDEVMDFLSVFWHRSRRQFLTWTLDELCRRASACPKETTILLRELNSLRLVKSARFRCDFRHMGHALTPDGEQIARATLERSGTVSPYIGRAEFKEARLKMRLTPARLAEALGTQVHSVVKDRKSVV